MRRNEKSISYSFREKFDVKIDPHFSQKIQIHFVYHLLEYIFHKMKRR